MSEEGLDGIPDCPPADGAGDGLLLEEGPLAVLADAEVAAGQDHDALLPVLADHAQLVLALALHLFEEHVFHLLSTAAPLRPDEFRTVIDNKSKNISSKMSLFVKFSGSKLFATLPHCKQSMSSIVLVPCCARSASS